jgi:ubiquinone/menaquinone biosynthesis C-methylase UbiE
MNKIDSDQKEYFIKAFQEILDGGIEKYDGFINPDSIWYWMHVYCLDQIKDFFKNIPPSTILTLGDSYCGREAAHIKRFGFGHHVHASDWQPCLIELAHKMGLVDEFSEQDMNNLKFEDNSFDFVFVKESLHHLSKPYQGIYEMLRVAKKGVILIEPSGENEQKHRFNNFEEVGNFVFSFTSHELVKVGLSFGIKYFAFTYGTVHYTLRNDDNIKNGRIQEEKERLIKLDESVPWGDKSLIVFFFLKDKETYDSIIDIVKYKKVIPVAV